MLGMFTSAPFHDGQLGEFRRSGGHWKGSLSLAPFGAFRLSLAGNRKAPDATAFALAVGSCNTSARPYRAHRHRNGPADEPSTDR
jgi:hypothetical protein